MENKQLEAHKVTVGDVDYTFFKLEFLPSGGKQYTYSNDKKEVYFRPMRLGETKALAKMISSEEDPKISELKRIYASCIRGVEIGEFCEIDFVALMTVINFYTQNNAGWNIVTNCPYEGCGKEVTRFVGMFDLDFTEPKYESLPIERATSDGKTMLFTLPSMTKIEEWENLKDDDTLDQDILSYAPMVISVDGADTTSVRSTYDILYNLSVTDYEMLLEVDNLIGIDMNPVKITCPHCSKEFDFEFSLKYQKAIPLL